MDSLRALLVQRAARLQDRPALTAPDWGTLSWSAWRRRVEGLGFALMGRTPLPTAVHAATGTAWDWAWEAAAACCGLPWDPGAAPLGPGLAEGPSLEAGRGPYHHREGSLSPATPFAAGLDHGAVLLRLRRLNDHLGWDHRTEVRLPLGDLALPGTRAALWSLAFAGGHARLEEGPVPDWDPRPFAAFWSP